MSYMNLPESAREHKALWILDLVLSPNPPTVIQPGVTESNCTVRMAHV